MSDSELLEVAAIAAKEEANPATSMLITMLAERLASVVGEY